jgi:hypothetical protein
MSAANDDRLHACASHGTDSPRIPMPPAPDPSAWPSSVERISLSGHGCGEGGPYLVLDVLEGDPWRRQAVFIRDRVFTLSRCEERHCTGRHDLETGRGAPCPAQATLRDPAHEQCGACFAATGFNPAFYNSPQISSQQRRRNLEPHVVYLVSFGAGVLKVGMTHAPRRLSRLLEQGARLGVVIASYPTADAARELEASIVRHFGVAESVRAARKRQLLGVPLSLEVARSELAGLLARVSEHHPEVDRQAPIQVLDPHYFGSSALPTSLTDLSETLPHCISGRCLGMIGDVIVMAQGARHFMLSIGDSVGSRIRLEPLERENRHMGQQALPF